MARKIRGKEIGSVQYAGFDVNGNYFPPMAAFQPIDGISGAVVPERYITFQDGLLIDSRPGKGSLEKDWPPVESAIIVTYDPSLGVQERPAGSDE